MEEKFVLSDIDITHQNHPKSKVSNKTKFSIEESHLLTVKKLRYEKRVHKNSKEQKQVFILFYSFWAVFCLQNLLSKYKRFISNFSTKI